jgi:hypothetical protein
VDSGTGTIPTTGPYDITETLPTVAGGTWTLVTAACIDATSSLSGTTLTVTPTSTATPLCLFINNFDPPGSITIQKTTVGALDSVNFLVFPAANDAQEFSQIATTTVQGQPATAQPETPADATTGLAPGLYVIQELTPADDDLGGWALTAAVCNGAPVTPTGGAVTVTLTAAAPDAGRDVLVHEHLHRNGGAGRTGLPHRPDRRPSDRLSAPSAARPPRGWLVRGELQGHGDASSVRRLCPPMTRRRPA